MAIQFLGCPATSASVERLFSQVGIAFSAKRKRAEADALADIMFARSNLVPSFHRRAHLSRISIFFIFLINFF